MTKTVKKVSVTNPQAKLYIITFNLLIMDGQTPVIDQDFSCEYRTGESVASKVNEVKEKMQKVISDYQSSQVIYNSAQLDSAVTAIEEGIVL